jgi:lipoprotein Spr
MVKKIKNRLFAKISLKKIITITSLLLVVSSCKTASTNPTYKKENKNSIAQKLINSATQNIGTPYKAGGKTKAGFDCSGLIYTIFESNQITMPRTSIQQSKTGQILNPKKETIKKGDLLFFKTNGSSQINHVGIVIETKEDEILFIHSSTSKGVMISSTKEPYFKKSLVQINRVLD